MYGKIYSRLLGSKMTVFTISITIQQCIEKLFWGFWEAQYSEQNEPIETENKFFNKIICNTE